MQFSENFLNRYEIINEIGEGSFGFVYRVVEKKALKREFALKVLKNKEAIEKFYDEIKLLNKLADCANILNLYDYEEFEDGLYILTEYKNSGDLFHYIKTDKTLDEKKAINFLTQILNALECAHSKNIIHKDIKPENILLHRVDDKIEYFIADWGLSSAKTSVSKSEGFKGTILYTPPEKFNKKRYFSSDIYSLGCTLYFALTKKLPYSLKEDSDFVDVMTSHLNDEIDLSLIKDEKLREIINSMLNKDPKERGYIKDLKELIDKGVSKVKDTRGSIEWDDEFLSGVLKDEPKEEVKEVEVSEVKEKKTKSKSNKLVIFLIIVGLVGGVWIKKKKEAVEKSNFEYFLKYSVWIDPDTNLMWQRVPSFEKHSWESAKEYCQNLNLAEFNDWRLATKDELLSLGTVKLHKYDNWSKWYEANKDKRNKNSRGEYLFIKKEIALYMPSHSWFLSATEYDNNSSMAWGVDFIDGGGTGNRCKKTKKQHILCVRQ